MISIIASLVGFIRSLLPEILKLIKDGKDKKHELEILDRQSNFQKSKSNWRLEEIEEMTNMLETKAIYQTYNTGIRFIDALNGSVRPVIAYGFFALYCFVKINKIFSLEPGSPLFVWMEYIWLDEDQAIFSGIISFYFGNRAFRYKK